MRNKILIVDDAELNREILKDMLGNSYEILEAGDGKQGLEILEREKKGIAVLLLDLIMPVMDGFQVLDYMQEKKLLDKIPVLIISGESGREIEEKCFECGVSDFIGKPFKASILRKRIENMIGLYQQKNELEKNVQKQTAVLRKAYVTLKAQAERIEKVNHEIIEILGTIVEYRSLESGEHIQRVQGYTRILAEEMKKKYPEYGLTEEKIEIIVSVSALHDLGKIAIPDNILLKPGRLTEEEFDFMKSHTIRGCEMLEAMVKNWTPSYKKLSYEICRYHHERYDGRGYPDGLKGDEIPISAQLVSIADVYDALVSERCYKDAYPLDEAFRMIVNGECGAFSPKLMEAFRNVREKFERYKNDSPKE